MNRFTRSTIVVAIAFFTVTAWAQFTLDQDVLGAHNVYGRGCVACHAPHSGSVGLGGSDSETGTLELWGRSFIAKTYQLESSSEHPQGSITTPSSASSFIGGDRDPLWRTAVCLSCHDGSAAIAGMHGTTVETVDGASAHAPTFLATDAQGLTNDHPVHIAYAPATAPNGSHWMGTVDATGKIWWANEPTHAAFIAAYGVPSFQAGAAGATTVGTGTPSTVAASYVECTSCHDQHSMTKHFQTIGLAWNATASCTTGGATNPYCGQFNTGGVRTVYPSRMFVKGWYDPTNPNSNSAAQFCRSCHANRSNENYGVNSITF